MKIYIFDYVDQLTDNWHSGGGLAIVAEDEEHARALLADYPETRPLEAEWSTAVVYHLAGTAEPKVWIFPDAGCC